MADPEQYREWAAQQVDTRMRDAMLDEADRIERRDAQRPGVTRIAVTIEVPR